MAPSHHRNRGFVHEHSLSIASICILTLWIVLYCVSDPSTHLGSFFGNALADGSGVVVTVLATKYLYEKRFPPRAVARRRRAFPPFFEWLPRTFSEHFPARSPASAGSRSISATNSEAKWGQVVGNIVSRVDANLRPGPAHKKNDRAPFPRKSLMRLV